MARGGKRQGAGRPKGAIGSKSRAAFEKAEAEGILPVDVMLTAMRQHAEAGRWDEAAKVAKDAAPYLHPRLAAIAHTGKDGGPIECSYDLSKLSDEELQQMRDLLASVVVEQKPAAPSRKH